MEEKDSSSSGGVTVAFDESDGTVIVVEAMDIYRVPRNKVAGGRGEGKSEFRKFKVMHNKWFSIKLFIFRSRSGFER